MNGTYTKDLKAFLDFYEQVNVCPYYFCDKSRITALIDDYAQRHHVTNDLDFVYFFRFMLKRLVGELDSHSSIRTRNEYEKLPLKINYSGSKLLVEATAKKYAVYNGKVVTKINNVSSERLIKEAEDAISYSTDGYRHLETSRFLSHYDPLRTLPSIESGASYIKYTFSDDSQLEVLVGEDGFVEPSTPKNFEIKVQGHNLWLHYHACKEEYQGQMLETVQTIKNLMSKTVHGIKPNKFVCFVLDLRGNVGGDDRVIRPLIDYLQARPDLEKQVFVDRAVQSAALFALNDMIKIGAQVFGTEIGSSMNHFGNNQRLELPSGRFLAISATRYFYLDENHELMTIRTQEDFANLDKKYVVPNLPDMIKSKHRGLAQW